MILLGIQPRSFDDLVVITASLALAACGLWLLVVVLAVLLEAWSDGRLELATRLGCPAPWRRALLAVFASTLAMASVQPVAHATQRPEPISLDGLPLPGRLTDASLPPPTSSAPTLVVQPGDTLWGLAGEALPRPACDAEVAAAVRALHEHNRDVIGPDPDQLRPGQRLVVPPPHPGATPTEGKR